MQADRKRRKKKKEGGTLYAYCRRKNYIHVPTQRGGKYPGVCIRHHRQLSCNPGKSGPEARICDYAWILDTMQQCREYDVPFWFKQTGANFKKGNRVYHIERKDQMSQAEKAGVNYRYRCD